MTITTATTRRLTQYFILLWLMISLLACGVVLRYALQQQEEDAATAFRILHRELSQKMAQHDALLSLTPQPQQLSHLKEKFPQLRQIRRLPTGATPPHAITITEQGEYWLTEPSTPSSSPHASSPMALLIDAPALFNALIQPNDFRFVRLSWQQSTLFTQGTANASPFWSWEKNVSSRSQPFLLHVESQPDWRQIPWLGMGALMVLWSVLMVALYQLLKQRHQRQLVELRANYAELTRLNTQEEVTAGIIHELRQPLTAVLSYNQTALRLLQQQQLQPLPSLLDHAVVQIKRIDELLTHFRHTLNSPERTRQWVNLPLIWQRVEMLLEVEIRQSHLKIIRQFPPAVPLLNADPLWIEQIFHNLLSNAIQAQQPQTAGATPPWVNIKISTQSQHLRIDVSDGGPGLSAEALEKVFIPFFTTRDNGFGLGMTLTETLVQRLQGSISVKNSPTHGACFTLLFPLEDQNSVHSPNQSLEQEST